MSSKETFRVKKPGYKSKAGEFTNLHPRLCLTRNGCKKRPLLYAYSQAKTGCVYGFTLRPKRDIF